MKQKYTIRIECQYNYAIVMEMKNWKWKGVEIFFKLGEISHYYITQVNKIDFFLPWNKTTCFCIILGHWVRIRNQFFSITSEFCSIANFLVARSENQSFAFCEKTIRDIENLNTYVRFKIKFCAFKKKILKIGSAVLEILAI